MGELAKAAGFLLSPNATSQQAEKVVVPHHSGPTTPSREFVGKLRELGFNRRLHLGLDTTTSQTGAFILPIHESVLLHSSPLARMQQADAARGVCTELIWNRVEPP